MQYAKCVNNKTYFEGDLADTFEPELIIGKVYKVLPLSSSERKGSIIRVIDGSGESYLYPQDYFELIDYNGVNGKGTSSVTVHLSNLLKGILHAEAIAANKSMSALVRQWIEERLDLPSGE